MPSPFASAARTTLLASILLACAGACQEPAVKPHPAGTEAERGTARGAMRGVTISTHGNGRDWGTNAMPAVLDDVAAVGAGWIAIHPYARIRADGTVSFGDVDHGRMISRPVEDAHARGMKILVKPHLAHWGSGFSWRGEIEFSSDEAWARFWDGYARWIEAVAEAAAAADAFAVGTELDRTLHFDAQWRDLIEAVRGRTSATLTYAANWTDYQRVGFWDALDLVGIQGYFPISDAERPSDEDLARGWRSLADQLRAYADAHQRDVVFTELGYNRSWAAARTPWEHATDGPEAEALQCRCMSTALRAIDAEPRIRGAFLWKWFPGSRPNGRDFPLATPEMRTAIRSVWAPTHRDRHP